MSFRKKAEEIEKIGALDRGEFNPTGKPKEIYQYWAKHSRKVPKTENFCHFWRVVAIWAPLTYLREQIKSLAEKSATWYTIAAAYVVAAIVLGIFVTPIVPLVAFGAPFIISNVITFAILISDGGLDEEDEKFFKTFVRINFIGSGLYFGGRAIGRLIDKVPVPPAWVEKVLAGIMGTALLGALVFLIVNAAAEFGWALLWGALLILAGIAVVVLIAAGIRLVFLAFAKRLSDKRYAKEVEEAELRAKRRAGEIPWPEPHTPGRIETFLVNFFKGVGDFVLLVWNVVRVNKWKICPIVKIED